MGSYLNFGRFGGDVYVTTARHLTTSATTYYEAAVHQLQPEGQAAITCVAAIFPVGALQDNNLMLDGNEHDIKQRTGTGGSGCEFSGQNSSSTSRGIRVDPNVANGSGWARDQWNTFGFCGRLDAGVGHLINNGVELTGSQIIDTVNGNSGETWNGNDFVERLGAVWFDGTIAQAFYFCHFWWDDSFIDLSNAANWAKFFDGDNKPIYLGDNGELPTGSQPLHFAPDGQLDNNLGSAGNWTKSGTIDQAPSSPTD